MRYFTAPIATMDSLRELVMAALNQPNGRAEEPWKVGGDFNDGEYAFVVLGEYHTSGDFVPLVEQLIGTPGVIEVNDSAYWAVMPQPEEVL